jgi:hypothetical protein
MWISGAWLVGFAVLAVVLFAAGFFFGTKAGCVYADRLTLRVGINPKWVASLDARQQARNMLASSSDDGVLDKNLQVALEEFEKNGGWTDLMLDGDAAQDVLRQLDPYIDWKLFEPTEAPNEAKRARLQRVLAGRGVDFRTRRAKAGDA